MRFQSAIDSAVTAITTTITVAAGVFAPGHLGELTRIVPVELADAVLEETRTRERRLRVLPSRVGIYFVLAMCLFPGCGYAGVWARLAAGPGAGCPDLKALRDLRRRLGPAPLKMLFEMLAGPLGRPRMPGIMFGRYRTVAFDGCRSVKVPDSPRNRAWLGKLRASGGETGYPVIALMTLCETGTRALPGAVFGTTAEGELAWARRLLHRLDASMLVLMDRGFDAGEFLAEVAATGAQFLVRLNSTRRPPVLRHLADGSVLSLVGGNRAWPAGALIELYHERWEHEIAHLALRHTLLQGRVLRSHDPAGPAGRSPSRRPGSWPPAPAASPARRAGIEDAEVDEPGVALDDGAAARRSGTRRRPLAERQGR